MTIFVLTLGNSEEGFDVIGAYSSNEKAHAAKKAYLEQWPNCISDFRIEDCDLDALPF